MTRFVNAWHEAWDGDAMNGDSRFERIAAEIGTLVAEKQAAYGDSYGKSGKVMRVLYPDGISPAQMDDALAVVRVIDKLFRIATRKGAFGESPWRDIAGYGLLGAAADAPAHSDCTVTLHDPLQPFGVVLR